MTSKTRGVKSIGLMAAAILMLAMTAGYTSAQNTNGDAAPFRGGRGRGPGGPGAGLMSFVGPIPMLASRLGLSDAQKDQIKAIEQSHADEWKALLDREQQARKAEQAAIATLPFDEVTIRQKSAELAAVQADVAVAQARTRGEVLQVLNTDQLNTLKTLEAKGPGRGARPGR
jgi:Spy/CpxP family protein refolding chaperone